MRLARFTRILSPFRESNPCSFCTPHPHTSRPLPRIRGTRSSQAEQCTASARVHPGAHPSALLAALGPKLVPEKPALVLHQKQYTVVKMNTKITSLPYVLGCVRQGRIARSRPGASPILSMLPLFPALPGAVLRPSGRPCERTTQRRNEEKSSRLQSALRPIHTLRIPSF